MEFGIHTSLRNWSLQVRVLSRLPELSEGRNYMQVLRAFILAAFIVGTTNWFASYADAQQMRIRMPCHDAAEIAKQLRNKYDEVPVAFGLQNNGNLLQVFSSEKKRTWTLVSTNPNGLSCIIAAGKHWETLPNINDGPTA